MSNFDIIEEMIVRIEIASGIEIVTVTAIGIVTDTAIEIGIANGTGTARKCANHATISTRIQERPKRRQTRDFLIPIKNCRTPELS